MEWDEKGHCRFYVQVFYLSVGEVGTSWVLRIIIAVTYLKVEVGCDCHRLVSGLSRTTSNFDAIRMIVDKLTSIVLSKVLDIV